MFRDPEASTTLLTSTEKDFPLFSIFICVALPLDIDRLFIWVLLYILPSLNLSFESQDLYDEYW